MSLFPTVDADGKVAISSLPSFTGRTPYGPAGLMEVCKMIAPLDGYENLSDDQLAREYGIHGRGITRIDKRVAIDIYLQRNAATRRACNKYLRELADAPVVHVAGGMGVTICESKTEQKHCESKDTTVIDIGGSSQESISRPNMNIPISRNCDVTQSVHEIDVNQSSRGSISHRLIGIPISPNTQSDASVHEIDFSGSCLVPISMHEIGTSEPTQAPDFSILYRTEEKCAVGASMSVSCDNVERRIVAASDQIIPISDFLSAKLNGFNLSYSKENMINLTEMIQASRSGKLLANWKQNDSSMAFLAALSEKLGIPEDKLYFSRTTQLSRGGGTWGHAYVAINIAQWLSPIFAIEVAEFVMRMMRGDLTLVAEVIDRHDAINETKTNVVSVAGASANQIRQTVITSVDISTLDVDTQAKLNEHWKQQNSHLLMRELDFQPIDENVYLKEVCKGKAIYKTGLNGIRYERALVAITKERFPIVPCPDVESFIRAIYSSVAQYDNYIKLREQSFEKFRCESEDKIKLLEDQLEGAPITEVRSENEQLRRSVAHLTNKLAKLVEVSGLKALIRELEPESQEKKCYELLKSIKTYEKFMHPDNARRIQLFLDNAQGHLNCLGTISSAIRSLLDGHIESESSEIVNAAYTRLVCENTVQKNELKHYVAAIDDIAKILSAEIAPDDFKSNIYHANIFTMVQPSNASPEYYRSLFRHMDYNSAEDYFGNFSDPSIGSAETKAPWETEEPEDDEATTKKKSKAKKPGKLDKSKPTRKSVAKGAAQLDERICIAIRAHLISLTSVLPIRPGPESDRINIYIGQDGFAPNLIPIHTSPIPKLYIYLTTGEIADYGVYHLYAGGSLTIRADIAPMDALITVKRSISAPKKHETGSKSSRAGLNEGSPTALNGGSSAALGGFGYTASIDYKSANAFHFGEICAIAKCLGDKLICAILPTRREMSVWNVYMPRDLVNGSI